MKRTSLVNLLRKRPGVDISNWGRIYFTLTPKGRRQTSRPRMLIKGTLIGSFGREATNAGAQAILAYFRRHLGPRSLMEIYRGLPVGYNTVSRRELLSGVTNLRRRGCLVRVR